MSVINFTLLDFGLASLAPMSPTVKFVPSGAGVAGGRLFASTAVQAVMTGAAGTVTLASTDGVVPETFYTVRIEHLQPGGQYTHLDLLGFKIFVPDGYIGPITELPGVPFSPNSMWTSLDAPPSSFKGWWLYSPAPGQTMPLDDPNIGDIRPVS